MWDTSANGFTQFISLIQARLQQSVNRELPDVEAGFRKGRGTRDQIANICCWIMEKAREFQKNIYFCFLTMPKPLTVWITINCGKFWKRWEYQRNLYAGQEATVRTGHGTTYWFQIGKGVRQGCILAPCLFNFYAEYITRNAGLWRHRLESRLPREISITSDMQITSPLWQKVKTK